MQAAGKSNYYFIENTRMNNEEQYNEMNTIPAAVQSEPEVQPEPAAAPPEVPPAANDPDRKVKHKSRVPSFIGGFVFGVLAVLIGFVLVRGYIAIPLGKLGILTLKLPYYNGNASKSDGSLNTREIDRKMKEIESLIGAAYLYEPDPQRMSDGIFTGMLYGLTDQDKYAQYYSVKAFEEENMRNNGSYDGIGVTVQTDEATGGMLVVSVNSLGPAKEAGVQVDDVIIKADGVDLTVMSLDEAVSDHVKGPAGTSVELTILRDGEEIELTVARARIVDITVRGTMISGTDAGYISITSFNRTTEGEFKKVITELESSGARGVVIDLRNNGGGDMDVCLRMLDYLLGDHLSVVNGESQDTTGKTLLLSVESRTGQATKYYASDREEHKLPIVLVVNGRSASASEIFTGVLMNYGCTSVGEKTFGKGIVQSVYRLSDQSGVKFTTDQYRLPGGELIHGIGIEPDVTLEFEDFDEVTSSLVNFASGEETDIEKDNQIMKAVEMLEK